MENDSSTAILNSRLPLQDLPLPPPVKVEAEGGCGVIGFASSVPVAGRHLLKPLVQMHNRGNGKGGGVAAIGLSPEQMGLSSQVLEEDYLIQIACLNPSSRTEVENEFIYPVMQVDKVERVPTLNDYRKVKGLEIKPPEVWRYFCRVKPVVLDRFVEDKGLQGLTRREAEDEYVYQNTFKLNNKFYAALGEKKAFILSHGRNMMVFKIVGYAEQAIQYYCLEDLKAYIWIGHQRYPTKGKLWHPGGAHPFIGMHEALVHNGDFANYYSITEYLRQRKYHPLFLTDTEVAALLFDLLNRIYRYPLEYLIEALAPTTERDFNMLPKEKQQIYKAIQASHIHGSPDGPWFFIIGRNLPEEDTLQLIGITDTSMLRPQVFALQEGEVKIGVIASEKQAIDAVLTSLSKEDPKFLPNADMYWNARGGSHTDGGAFIFTVSKKQDEEVELTCTDKFGRTVTTVKNPIDTNPPHQIEVPTWNTKKPLQKPDQYGSFNHMIENVQNLKEKELNDLCRGLTETVSKGETPNIKISIETLTSLLDKRIPQTSIRRSALRTSLTKALYTVFTSIPKMSKGSMENYCLINYDERAKLSSPMNPGQVLVIDVGDFPSEGSESSASFIVKAYKMGWKRMITFNWKGQRFCGCGLGPNSSGVRIDVYGSPGDYLGSGLDGSEINVHGNGQDQLGQILKSGRMVVYGDVGQTFMYGAKGGEVYVLGNAAGRPLINAVGRPRVVINGTCLDYLAESFMAGDPLNGGGFVILNGIQLGHQGKVLERVTPYPGGNLFSLASGGAIYIRDPYMMVENCQLNGGAFSELTNEDWNLILPYLQENEKLFGISIEKDLLTVDGITKKPMEVYRKVKAVPLSALSSEGD